MRITRDIEDLALHPELRGQPSVAAIVVPIVVPIMAALIALLIWITPYRPLRWPAVRTVIHMQTQDPLEIQSECNRWIMQPDVCKVWSARQSDGTTDIVMLTRR
jgi:hypothetical protein